MNASLTMEMILLTRAYGNHPTWPDRAQWAIPHLPRSARGPAERLSGVSPLPSFFAAGEFSNDVWGFYEPAQSIREFLLTRVK